MLGLTQKVGCDHLNVGGIIGNDQGLGRTSQKIDTNRPKKLAFGLCDISVAGSDQHINGVDRFGSQRERCDGLNSSEDKNLICPGEDNRCDGGCWWCSFERRGSSDHPFNAGYLSGDHAHMGGRYHRISSARNVRSNAIDRNVLVPQPNSRNGFNLDVGKRSPLCLGERANLLLGKLDVPDHSFGNGIEQLLDF